MRPGLGKDAASTSSTTARPRIAVSKDLIGFPLSFDGIECTSPRLVGRRMYRLVRPGALDGTAGCSVPRASTSSSKSSSRVTRWRRFRRNGALRVCEPSFLAAGGPGPSSTSAGRTRRSSSTVTRYALGRLATCDGSELPKAGNHGARPLATGHSQASATPTAGPGSTSPAPRRAPATVVKAAQIIGKVMKTAVRSRRIAHNPMAEVSLPTITEPEDIYLTPAQVESLAKMQWRMSGRGTARSYGSGATAVPASANCWPCAGATSTSSGAR